jgi:hypothetical protein
MMFDRKILGISAQNYLASLGVHQGPKSKRGSQWTLQKRRSRQKHVRTFHNSSHPEILPSLCPAGSEFPVGNQTADDQFEDFLSLTDGETIRLTDKSSVIEGSLGGVSWSEMDPREEDTGFNC